MRNSAENHGLCVLKKQIIKRKIDPTQSSSVYYSKVRYDIRRRIYPDTELLIIEIVPKSEITKKLLVQTLMYMQREFTSVITVPKNSADLTKEDLQKFESLYECTVVHTY